MSVIYNTDPEYPYTVTATDFDALVICTSLLNLHARTLGTTINETVQTAGVESILAIIYTVANGKDRVYFGPAAR